MAATSLFVLLDDIASVLDDVATMTKVATKKTAGVLGDDLALNAQQVAGLRAERELPVVWAVAMFLVGGGILSQGLPPVHHAIEAATADMVGVAGALLPSALDGLVGIAAGIVVLLVVSIMTRLLRPRTVAL